MKKHIIFCIILLTGLSLQGQIKMHSNGRITFQTVNNTTNQGMSIDPSPNYSLNVNGKSYFKECAFFLRNATSYQFINCTKAIDNYAMAWVLTLNDWTTAKFYVHGKGDVYGKHYYTMNTLGGSKGAPEGTPVTGLEAVSTLMELQGLWYEPETQEIPNLEDNENIVPEAVQAMYLDFEKRNIELSATRMDTYFPEATRTDHQNRLCIDYNAVVTMLVEAFKEQQLQIKQLQQMLMEKQ